MTQICLCRDTFMRILKFARRGGFRGKIPSIKRAGRKRSRKRSSSGRKLRPGVHRVNIRGKMRKVRVLRNGRWRFMKG